MRAATILAASAVGVLLVGSAYLVYFLGSSPGTTMSGSLFVSDAGQSHGGFEYTASYNVTLDVNGGKGLMVVALDVGLGDVLTKHEYQVTEFHVTADAVTMKVDGTQVSLPFTASDSVWNHSFDNSYIASWGSASPPQEIRGTISPSIFLGMPSTYYLELRLA